jgi:hypothetical protein
MVHFEVSVLRTIDHSEIGRDSGRNTMRSLRGEYRSYFARAGATEAMSRSRENERM